MKNDTRLYIFWDRDVLKFHSRSDQLKFYVEVDSGY